MHFVSKSVIVSVLLSMSFASMAQAQDVQNASAQVKEAIADDVGLKVGEKAPPFKLPVINAYKETAKRFGTHQFDSHKTILMGFFSMDCAPCKKEMPELVRLYNKYESKGLGMMLVSIDGSDAVDQVIGLTEENKVNFPVVHDRFKLVAKRYDARTLPYLLILSPERDIQAVHIGYTDEVKKGLEDELRAKLGLPKKRVKKKKKRRRRRRKR